MSAEAAVEGAYPVNPDCYAGHDYTKWPSYAEWKCYYCGVPEPRVEPAA